MGCPGLLLGSCSAELTWIWGLGFGVQGLGFRVWGLGVRF